MNSVSNSFWILSTSYLSSKMLPLDILSALLIFSRISSRFSSFSLFISSFSFFFISSFLSLALSRACFLVSSFLLRVSTPNASLACDVIVAAFGSSNLKLYFVSNSSISSSLLSSSLSTPFSNPLTRGFSLSAFGSLVGF